MVHRALRDDILRGDISPGAWLSQVQIARRFGISRGPVREALRLLERERLIEAELNQRVRVARFSMEDLEQLYATRVVVEALAIATSVPRYTEQDLAGFGRLLSSMDDLAGRDIDRWEAEHRRFHLALVAAAGDGLVRLIEQLMDHGERYRRVYVRSDPRAWAVGADEHRDIVQACIDRDSPLASSLLSRHLARTALTIFMMSAPEHEPATLRAAIRQVSAGSATEPEDDFARAPDARTA